MFSGVMVASTGFLAAEHCFQALFASYGGIFAFSELDIWVDSNEKVFTAYKMTI